MSRPEKKEREQKDDSMRTGGGSRGRGGKKWVVKAKPPLQLQPPPQPRLNPLSIYEDVERKTILAATDRIRDNLKKDTLNGDTFNTMLLNSKTAIAGSYPLQALLNKRWVDVNEYADMKTPFEPKCRSFAGTKYTDSAKTDIDLWADENSNLGYVFRDLMKMGYTMCPTKGKLEELTYKRLRSTISKMYMFNYFGYLTIQLLVTKKGVTINDAINNFDLSICQISYNGEEMRLHSPDYMEQIRRMKTYITRSAILSQSLFEWYRTGKRISKYNARGIITPPEAWENMDIFRSGPFLCYGIEYNYNNQNDPLTGTSFINLWNRQFWKEAQAWLRNLGAQDLPLVPSMPIFVVNRANESVDFVLDGRVLSRRYYLDLIPNDREIKLSPELPQIQATRETEFVHSDFVKTDEERAHRAISENILGDVALVGLIKEHMADVCYSFVDMENISFKNFLVGNEDENIDPHPFGISIRHKDTEIFVCYDLKELVEGLQDQKYIDDNVFYECDEKAYMKGFIDRPYVLVRLDKQCLIPLPDIIKMIKAYRRGTHHFMIIETDQILNKTSSHKNVHPEAVRNHRSYYVSSDHCQDGSDKRVYRIKIIGYIKKNPGGLEQVLSILLDKLYLTYYYEGQYALFKSNMGLVGNFHGISMNIEEDEYKKPIYTNKYDDMYRVFRISYRQELAIKHSGKVADDIRYIPVFRVMNSLHSALNKAPPETKRALEKFLFGVAHIFINDPGSKVIAHLTKQIKMPHRQKYYCTFYNGYHGNNMNPPLCPELVVVENPPGYLHAPEA